MTERRTPPKQRGTTTCRCACGHDQPEAPSYDDPGMPLTQLGGQFEDAGYPSGLGQFGFGHHVRPPS